MGTRIRIPEEIIKRGESMGVKDFKFEIATFQEVRPFIEKWHYSHNVNGIRYDYCFKLMHQGEMIGAMIFGRIAMANVWKRYGEKESDVIELRRLCCIDDTPKNTESYFIGHALRWLKKNTDIKVVVSYADKDYGHKGIIYKATNFKKVGETAKGRIIIYNGKRYHDKAIRTKDRHGKLKPFAIRLREALESGEAYYKRSLGKHIYIYQLKSK